MRSMLRESTRTLTYTVRLIPIPVPSSYRDPSGSPPDGVIIKQLVLLCMVQDDRERRCTSCSQGPEDENGAESLPHHQFLLSETVSYQWRVSQSQSVRRFDPQIT